MSLYMIAYDIESNKNRTKIHKILSEHAFAMQYSVFVFQGTNSKLKELVDSLEKYIDAHDQVICVTINTNATNLKIPKQNKFGIQVLSSCQVLNTLLN